MSDIRFLQELLSQVDTAISDLETDLQEAKETPPLTAYEMLGVLEDVESMLEDKQNQLIFDEQERVPWPNDPTPWGNEAGRSYVTEVEEGRTQQGRSIVAETQDDTYAVVFPYEGRITGEQLQRWAYDCMVDLGWLEGGHASCEVVTIDEAIDYLEERGFITLRR